MAEIDIVEVPEHDAVDDEEVTLDFKLLVQQVAERMGDIAVEHNVERQLAVNALGEPAFDAGGEGGAADTRSTIQQGFVEKSNVNSVMEMSHMVEVMRTYTNIANILQSQSDLHKNAIDKLADVPA